MKKIIFYFLGSLAVSYGVAMGLRILAVVAPNDQVRLRNFHKKSTKSSNEIYLSSKTENVLSKR